MKPYVAIDGDRIDTIVYKHYGTLDDVLEAVIAANQQLPAILSAGYIVYLPEVVIKPIEVYIW